jgi:hypothetical protein
MTKRPEPNRYVMLNLFQHLISFFCLKQRHLSYPPLPTGRQALQKGGIPPFGKKGLGEIFTMVCLSNYELLSNLNGNDVN